MHQHMKDYHTLQIKVALSNLVLGRVLQCQQQHNDICNILLWNLVNARVTTQYQIHGT